MSAIRRSTTLDVHSEEVADPLPRGAGGARRDRRGRPGRRGSRRRDRALRARARSRSATWCPTSRASRASPTPTSSTPGACRRGRATPLWVADNGTDVPTLYSGGVRGSIPVIGAARRRDPRWRADGHGLQPDTGFAVGGAAARFIFDSEAGQITAWHPGLGTQAQTVAATPHAIYKGLALAATPKGAWLYAADFHGGKIDVFDDRFGPVHLKPGAFADHALPAGFAPFNVQELGGSIYVSYAKQDADAEDEVAGAGLGYVDASIRPGACSGAWSPGRSERALGPRDRPGGLRRPRRRAARRQLRRRRRLRPRCPRSPATPPYSSIPRIPRRSRAVSASCWRTRISATSCAPRARPASRRSRGIAAPGRPRPCCAERRSTAARLQRAGVRRSHDRRPHPRHRWRRVHRLPSGGCAARAAGPTRDRARPALHGWLRGPISSSTTTIRA